MSTLKKKLVVPLEPGRNQADGPWAIQLALDIIEQDFGFSVKCVSEALIELGLSSVQDIRGYFAVKAPEVRCGGQRFDYSTFTISKIKACLIVLLTHELAAAHVTFTNPSLGITAPTLTGTLLSHVAVASGVFESNAVAETITNASVVAPTSTFDYGAPAESETPSAAKSSTASTAAAKAKLVKGKKAASAVSDNKATAEKEPTTAPAKEPSTAAAPTTEDGDSAEFSQERYRLDTHKVLLRLRFPHFIAVTKRQFGDAGAAIAQSLLQHGPWRKNAILKDAARLLALELAERNGLDPAGTAGSSKDQSFPPPPTTTPGLKRKRSTSTASGISGLSGMSTGDEVFEEPAQDLPQETIAEALEQATQVWVKMVDCNLVLPAEGTGLYGLPKSLRGSDLVRTHPELLKRMGIDTTVSSKVDTNGDAADDAPARKKPRLEGAGASTEYTHTDVAEKSVVWRFGWEVAMKRLRNDLVLRYVKGLVTGGEANVDAAKRIVDVIMRRSEGHEKGYNVLRSAAITVEAIAQTIQASSSKSSGTRSVSPGYAGKAGSNLTPANIHGILTTLTKLPTAPVVEVSSFSQPLESKQYYVDYAAVLTLLQLRTIENVIQEKFHVHAARIVRLLLERGALDEKNISDLIMLPQKDARAAVFNLLQHGVLHVEEVPRRPDHHPQFTFFLFDARFKHLVHELSEWTHQASLNLRRRLRMEVARFRAAERAQQEGTMQLPEAVRRAVLLSAEVDPDEDVVDEADLNETALTIMEGATERLRAGLLRTDVTLLLLRDLYRSDVETVSKVDMDAVALSITKAASRR